MNDHTIGVDVGSVAASVAVVSNSDRVVWSGYRPHHGRPAEALDLLFRSLRHALPTLPDELPVAATVETPRFFRADTRVDSVVAHVRAARMRHPDCRSLLVVGGARFFLVRFRADGSYVNMRGSSSCAAGTGSFLDQQARRLDLGTPDSGDDCTNEGCVGAAELSRLAMQSDGQRPHIASRCSVFAKTDLIHAQQEGYSLPQICDGLCHGLARNLINTVAQDDRVAEPVVFAGGVSRNEAVCRHIEEIIGVPLRVDRDSNVYGAIGAALEAAVADPASSDARTSAPDGQAAPTDGAFPGRQFPPLRDRIDTTGMGERSYQYEPLELHESSYPDFDSHRCAVYVAQGAASGKSVEVDLYEAAASTSTSTGARLAVRIGIDIGSTSTKAMLVTEDGTAVAGFYTRTSGAPVRAVQAVFEAVDAAATDEGWDLEILGVATTGSGRSFVGAIVGADLVLDEISAHARAAVEIDPRTDTIIEIGGQDAKFTTLERGVVTFSHMNTVCAAGTGSFLEEQASKLGVPLSDYAGLAEGVRAPLASDRCTVFMERDINNYLNRGYTAREILAAALHSVRENYLHKVASVIGDHVCFQGATAKNRALVAAFEQKLGKPITVSLYCHLTGAYGAALVLADEAREAAGRGYASKFRGLELFRERVPVETEVCTLCANTCRIRLATVQGERVAFGFLCGRDYETDHRVSENTSGYDLLRDRARTLRQVSGYVSTPIAGERAEGQPRVLIGIPSGLYLAEAQPFWETFFAVLGLPVVTSRAMHGIVGRGRRVAGAEFCAPMMQFHGEVDRLLEVATHVFVPVQLSGTGSARIDEVPVRSYCYYSQMVSSIVGELESGAHGSRFIRPLIDLADRGTTVDELHRALQHVCRKSGFGGPTRGDVARAFDRATQVARNYARQLAVRFSELRRQEPDRLDVVLVGRPYTVLSREMNHRIPELFGKHGARVFFQDMVAVGSRDTETVAGLLSEVPWSYASRVLEVAAACGRTPGLYPVLVTSFKCSPDSFIVDYFKQILTAHDKPYLILQLDDHDSTVGYETRIEAALRAFRNHHRRPAPTTGIHHMRAPVGPVLSPSMDGKTVLFPRWDGMTNRLLVAGLRSRGIDTRLLPEDQITIQRAMRTNSGQCIPVNIIAEECLDYVREHDLDPERTVLWMPKAKWACNIPLYPHHIKSLFDAAGVPIGVYSGDFTMRDISIGATYDAYFAYLFGGMLRRLGCMIRPYETTAGETNRIIAESMAYLDDVFSSGSSKSDAWEDVVTRLVAVERDTSRRRSQVAVFGDLYVRDNDTANQNLLETIEQAGGEVVTTPYSDYVKVIANAHFRKLWRNRELIQWGTLRAVHAVLTTVERRFYRPLSDLMPDGPDDVSMQDIDAELAEFGMRSEQSGESVENVLKIFHILRHHPDVSLFVQASPAFCCPSLVTEALASRVQRLTGVPVVSVTYDGTGTFQNEIIVPYLKLAG